MSDSPLDCQSREVRGALLEQRQLFSTVVIYTNVYIDRYTELYIMSESPLDCQSREVRGALLEQRQLFLSLIHI